MKKITILFTLIILCFSTNTIYAQDSINCMYPARLESKLKIGIKHSGILFGGFNKVNGLNLSLIDKSCKINGLSLSASHNFDSFKTTNGIDLTAMSYMRKCNGMGISLGGEIDELNGLGLFLVFGTGMDANGVLISGLIQMNMNKTKGLMITGLYGLNFEFTGVAIVPGFLVSDSLDRGLMIAGLLYSAESSVGVSISAVNKTVMSKGVQIGLINSSQNHTGIQFGILNINQRNPKWLRYLPIINLNFRKKNKA